jgi:alpha-amylase
MLSLSLCVYLPAGDVISGAKVNGACTGKSITVFADTRALFSISTSDFDGVIAIHIEAKL